MKIRYKERQALTASETAGVAVDLNSRPIGRKNKGTPVRRLLQRIVAGFK